MKVGKFIAKLFKRKSTHYLNFLGRGSCFSNDHASAFFVTQDNDFVLIDCSEQAYQRLKNEFDLPSYNSIYIYITHTHGDHIGGLSSLVHYAYFALNKIVTVIAPSKEVMNDIKVLLRIEGVLDVMYNLSFSQELIPSLTAKLDFTIPEKVSAISISTRHTESLESKCFGFYFYINGLNIIYTGDTATLEPFIPFLKNGSELYVDTSVKYKSDVHLWLSDMLPALTNLTQNGVKVYLMHLDDVKKAKKIVKNIPNIEIVQLV